MKKFALMIAAIATIFLAAPTSKADAQTVVIKRGGGHHGAMHRGSARAQMHRGHRGHGSKIIVVKKRHHHY